MSIVAIIQARVGSTRLPGKVLMDLNGQTVLERVHGRVASSKLVDKVVIATTTNPADDRIVELGRQKGMIVERGSENDVLDRYYQVAQKYRPDHIIRITSDCPLIDPLIIDQVIEQHLREQNDYTSNAFIESYPDGQDTEIFTFPVLKEAWSKAILPSQREHVTQYVTKNADKFKIGNLAYKKILSSKRWTLDEPTDYSFIKAIYDGLADQDDNFGLEVVLNYLEEHPELEKLNHHIVRNEGLLKSLEKDKVFKKGK